MTFAIEGVPVGRLLQCSPKEVAPNSIENTALDGTPYLQIIGDPARSITVEVFAPSLIARELIDRAGTRGAAVSAEYHGVTYEGYISGAVSWKWLKKGVSAIGTFKVRVMDT